MNELNFNKQEMRTVCAALHNMFISDCENSDEKQYVEKLMTKAESIKEKSVEAPNLFNCGK